MRSASQHDGGRSTPMNQRRSRDTHLLQITGFELAFIFGLLLLVTLTFGSIAVAYDIINTNGIAAVPISATTETPTPAMR